MNREKEIMREALKQKLIVLFCSLQLLFFIVSQVPFVDVSQQSPEIVGQHASFFFSAINKIREWRNDPNSFFNHLVNSYFSITLLGYPSYYFSLGAPTTYRFYAFEFTDASGTPLPGDPYYTTCPLPWSECLAGRNYSDNIRLPLFEMIMIHEQFHQDSGKQISPQYFMLENARATLKKSHTDKFVAFVVYEQPVLSWFRVATGPLKRRVIHVTN